MQVSTPITAFVSIMVIALTYDAILGLAGGWSGCRDGLVRGFRSASVATNSFDDANELLLSSLVSSDQFRECPFKASVKVSHADGSEHEVKTFELIMRNRRQP